MKTAMLNGRLNKHYQLLIRRNSVITTKKEFYNQLIDEGYTPEIIENIQTGRQGTNCTVYCLRSKAGDYYDIPKIVHDDLKSK